MSMMDSIEREYKKTIIELGAENKRLGKALAIAREHIGIEGDCVEQSIQKEIEQALNQ